MNLCVHKWKCYSWATHQKRKWFNWYIHIIYICAFCALPFTHSIVRLKLRAHFCKQTHYTRRVCFYLPELFCREHTLESSVRQPYFNTLNPIRTNACSQRIATFAFFALQRNIDEAFIKKRQRNKIPLHLCALLLSGLLQCIACSEWSRMQVWIASFYIRMRRVLFM